MNNEVALNSLEKKKSPMRDVFSKLFNTIELFILLRKSIPPLGAFCWPFIYSTVTNTSCMQFVVSNLSNAAKYHRVIRYYLFNTTSKSRIWLFLELSMFFFQTTNSIPFACFDQLETWIWYLFAYGWQLTILHDCFRKRTFDCVDFIQ